MTMVWTEWTHSMHGLFLARFYSFFTALSCTLPLLVICMWKTFQAHFIKTISVHSILDGKWGSSDLGARFALEAIYWSSHDSWDAVQRWFCVPQKCIDRFYSIQSSTIFTGCSMHLDSCFLRSGVQSLSIYHLTFLTNVEIGNRIVEPKCNWVPHVYVRCR